MLSSDMIASAGTKPFVLAENIAKSYGGVHALAGVSLAIAPGEVHGLVGANGAGKSTLIKVLAGLVQPDAGRVLVDGVPVSLPTPHHATDLGMSFIHQELAFIPGMTVLQNILLGVPKKTRFGMVDWQAAARDVAPIAERVGIKAPLFASVKGLSTAENWLINICRALVRKARLIVMDEPTASLSAAEAEKLFAIVEDLSASGVAVLYVSHRLDEIMRLCSRVSIFRDGRSVGCLEGAAITRPALIEAIVGGKAELAAAPERRAAVKGDVALTVKGITRADRGAMTLDGAPFAPRSATEAVKAGLGLVPEERRAEGLLLTKSVAFNLQIANLANIVRSPVWPLIHRRKREALSLQIVRDLAVKTPGIDTPVGRLSGGNQQKVVIGRWLLRAPKVLILDEPTRGVDIGARGEIHRLVRELAARGMAVIVISSEPDELPDLCDRVLIMVEGRIVSTLEGSAITRNAIVEASYFVGREPVQEDTI